MILRDIIIEQIRELITSEQLQRGQRLPPERALAMRFAVSRHLVREALRVLEQQNVVVSRIGSGSYVEDPTAKREYALTEATLRQRSNLMEILEFRRTLEPRIAYLAANNVKENAREELTAILNTMDIAGKKRDLTAWRNADTAFHSYLASMAGNFLYEKTVGLLHQAMISFNPASTEQHLIMSLNAHKTIAAAILKGNGNKAASAMEQHIITTVHTALGTLPGTP